MKNLEKSAEVFKSLGERFGGNLISDPFAIKEFFNELLAKTSGLVILDFLDLANWDRINSYDLDLKTGLLTLVWHDYRGVKESYEDREMRQMAFPASLYALSLYVKNIAPIVGKKSAIFLVNGFSRTEKEIRQHFQNGCDEFQLQDNSFFEKRVIRKVKEHWEIIDFHCTPIYSLAIIPKACGISSFDSKRMLYRHNVSEALTRLNRVMTALEGIEPSDSDGISEKVNTVRRIFEFVLKVECCYRKIELNKNYSQILLGDLIAAIKKNKDDYSKVLNKFVVLANEFSHDSGKPVELIKAQAATAIAVAYTNLFEMECRSAEG